jgi:N-acetylmuramic acid 6-phosphate etherase
MSQLIGRERLLGFDFSPRAQAGRRRLTGDADHHWVRVARTNDELTLCLDGVDLAFSVAGLPTLAEHVLLKLLLNIHSTLVMGRLGRYDSNLMTWVRPSNRKLIDRAIRYVDELLRAEGGPALGYDELALACFREMEALGNHESIVRKTLAAIRRGASL